MKRSITLSDLTAFELFSHDVRSHARAIEVDITSDQVIGLWLAQPEPQPEVSPPGLPHSQYTEDANEIERMRNDRARHYDDEDEANLDLFELQYPNLFQ